MSPSQNISSVSNNANESDCAVDGASNSTQLPSEQLGIENEVCSVDTSPLDERQTPDYESASLDSNESDFDSIVDNYGL